jgi:hypothetical protein
VLLSRPMRGVALLALVAFAGASLLASGAASAKDQPSTIYVNQGQGYRITVPRTWQVVKPSVAAVKQTIAQLKKQKKTQLAAVYSDLISTAAGRNELSSFSFRAFRWPLLPSPVPTDVTVFIQAAPKSATQADLGAIGASFARQFAAPGARIDKPQVLSLPAGKAALVTGAIPLPKPNQGFATGFSLVMFLHGGRLYMLSFRIDAAVASQAKVFASIAQRFRFCPAKGSCT